MKGNSANDVPNQKNEQKGFYGMINEVSDQSA